MGKINWQYYKVSNKKEYDTLFNKTVRQEAYKSAYDIRKFEITMYWTRTAYFWAFITSIYVAYYNLFTKVYDKTMDHFVLFVFSALGLLFSISWVYSMKGSKHWQENWENHMELLEDPVTGPLYKTYSLKNDFSVTKINLYNGYFITIASSLLYLTEIVLLVKKIEDNFLIILLISFLFVMISFLLIILLILKMKGNTKDYGDVEFEHKIYR